MNVPLDVRCGWCTCGDVAAGGLHRWTPTRTMRERATTCHRAVRLVSTLSVARRRALHGTRSCDRWHVQSDMHFKHPSAVCLVGREDDLAVLAPRLAATVTGDGGTAASVLLLWSRTPRGGREDGVVAAVRGAERVCVRCGALQAAWELVPPPRGQMKCTTLHRAVCCGGTHFHFARGDQRCCIPG